MSAAFGDRHGPTPGEVAESIRRSRWEGAAWGAGREVDQNALTVYMKVADTENAKIVKDLWSEAAAYVSDLAVRCDRPEPCLRCEGVNAAADMLAEIARTGRYPR